MANDDLIAHLLRVEIFQQLSLPQITMIARHAERIKFRAGDEITISGESADAALLIVGGAAEWLDGPASIDGREAIEIGSLIGEMSMFIDYIYGASIVARGPVKCLKITREAMHELMLEDSSMAEILTAKIAQRLTRLADDLRAIDADFEETLPDVLRAAPGDALAMPAHH